MYIMKDTNVKYKDPSGEKVYFKEPYFDKALRRTFKSVEEKHRFMHEHRICSNGDSDAKAKQQWKEHEESKHK